ncbi:MAG: glycosyltransferase [Candidatus Pacebacteria bacterium]|nr:glycosyltransferase [Candidatus Paceibacterota bacterium]
MKRVSVILPVTRPKKAREAISLVKKQKRPGFFLEIIAVDDKKRLSPARRRNLGARRARGDILVFLDDDCLPRGGWLKAVAESLADDKMGAAGGQVRGKSKRYFARSVDFACFTFEQGEKRRKTAVSSSCLVIKKETFGKMGGFDESLRIGEDADLCQRLKKAGLETVYEPKIRVWHRHGRKTLSALLAYQFHNGKVKGLTIEKRYQNSFPARFLSQISFPGIYGFFVLPLATLATAVTLAVNFRDRPEVFLYLPGIFLGKLALQTGVFVWTLKEL